MQQMMTITDTYMMTLKTRGNDEKTLNYDNDNTNPSFDTVQNLILNF